MTKLCPICKIEFRNLWKHFWDEHKNLNLSDEDFLAKYLNLNSVPTCNGLNCNNKCQLIYKYYKFSDYCCRSCISKLSILKCHKSENTKLARILNLKKFRENNPDIIKKNIEIWNKKGRAALKFDKQINPDKYSKIASNNIKKFNKNNFELHRSICRNNLNNWRINNKEKSDEIRRINFGKLRVDHKSKIEIKIYNKLLKIFINKYKISSNKQILGYYPDILIDELKLIIEIDGDIWHDLNKDISRDKLLESKGYHVRRLDSNYVSTLTDLDLIYLVNLESTIKIPYYERIPIDQLMDWKSDIYQTGPRYLLK